MTSDSNYDHLKKAFGAALGENRLEKWPDKDGVDDHGREGGSGGDSKVGGGTATEHGTGNQPEGHGEDQGGTATGPQDMAGQNWETASNEAMNSREGGPLKVGERVTINQNWRDKGEKAEDYVVTGAEEKGRVDVQTVDNHGLTFNPINTLQSFMVTRKK